MASTHLLKEAIPHAPLKIAALESCTELGEKVNNYIVKFRREEALEDPESAAFNQYVKDSYLLETSIPRFGSGEAKGVIKSSVRGVDLFLFVDVTNHHMTYTINGLKNHMSPDDHYQNLKRVIAAANGKARRINVIMPFLYESRQHRRTGRESLDCALALQELRDMGVSNIITFDAHDPRVQNAIPLKGFDSFNPAYQFMKALFRTVPDLHINKDELMIISPDEGAMPRAVYLSNILKVDMGMFYKRRDYSQIVDGKNPIVAHEFLGDNVEGKDVIIIDDMVASGGSMLDVARQLKERKARRVIACTTFGLFTEGMAPFDKANAEGILDYLITTNLTYIPKDYSERPFFALADMSKYLAYIVDGLNHDTSISSILDPTDRIHRLLEKMGQCPE